MLGAFVGWKAVFWILLFSSFLGSFVGIFYQRSLEDPVKWADRPVLEVDDMDISDFGAPLSRRLLLCRAGLAALTMATSPALARTTIDLPLPGGPDRRQIATDFPQKAAMILQRSRPPLPQQSDQYLLPVVRDDADEWRR